MVDREFRAMFVISAEGAHVFRLFSLREADPCRRLFAFLFQNRK